MRARRWLLPCPPYLNALTGNGVHIVTVNDYLAARDAEEMGKVYGFMGLTTGLVVHGQTQAEKTRRLQRGYHVRHQ